MNHSIHTNKLELSSTIENLILLEDFIDDAFVLNNHLNYSHGNILMALSEAFTNAVQHGNQNNIYKFVLITMEFSDSNVVFSVSDEGNGFNYDSIPDPTLPNNIEKLHGRGLFLMKNLSDSISFDNNGSKVKLTFNLK
jgi:serine/threonine-protein kinase RsbW